MGVGFGIRALTLTGARVGSAGATTVGATNVGAGGGVLTAAALKLVSPVVPAGILIEPRVSAEGIPMRLSCSAKAVDDSGCGVAAAAGASSVGGVTCSAGTNGGAGVGGSIPANGFMGAACWATTGAGVVAGGANGGSIGAAVEAWTSAGGVSCAGGGGVLSGVDFAVSGGNAGAPVALASGSPLGWAGAGCVAAALKGGSVGIRGAAGGACGAGVSVMAWANTGRAEEGAAACAAGV